MKSEQTDGSELMITIFSMGTLSLWRSWLLMAMHSFSLTQRHQTNVGCNGLACFFLFFWTECVAWKALDIKLSVKTLSLLQWSYAGFCSQLVRLSWSIHHPLLLPFSVQSSFTTVQAYCGLSWKPNMSNRPFLIGSGIIFFFLVIIKLEVVLRDLIFFIFFYFFCSVCKACLFPHL